MPPKITTVVNDYVFEYFGEWKIENYVISKDAFEKTPVFSPIPHSDVRCHLEIRYTSQQNIQFTLVKIPGTANNPSLKMKSDLRVSDMSGNCLKYYSLSSTIRVSELNRLTFQEKEQSLSYFYGRNSFIVSCHMVFFEFSFTRPIACRKEDCFTENVSVDKPSVIGDIELQIDGQSFPAHRAVLRARAPVFLEKLPRNSYESDKIVLDTSFRNVNVQCFLNYLYTGKIEDMSWNTVRSLHALAHKYEIGDLKRDCATIVESSLNLATVCGTLKLAYDCNDVNLKEKALAFAANHMNDLLKKENWKKLLLDYPMIGYDVMAISFAKK